MGRIGMSSRPKNIKANNRKIILSLFRYSENLTVSGIADRVKLSKTTTTKIISELLKQGYVVSAGKGSSTDEGGKKPELFRFNATNKYIIVISMDTTGIAAYLFVLDLKCNVCYSDLLQFNKREIPYKKVVSAYISAIRRALKNCKLEQGQIYAIELAIDGIVDVKRGILKYSFHNRWKGDLPFCADIAAGLGFRTNIYLDNICSYLGYAELKNSNYDERGVAFLYADVHTGGCIIRNGRLIHSAHGYAGEFGHMILTPESTVKCSCGGNGCFEALVSTGELILNAIRHRGSHPKSLIFQDTPGNMITENSIFNAANQGDELACLLMDEIIKWFSIAIHNISIVYDPDIVILQGSYRDAGEYFISGLRRALLAIPFYNGSHHLVIKYSEISPSDAMGIGGSYYATNRYLEMEEQP
ncbi:MAG: ROK family transcriptional regulator [Treponema sp.]|jgi:predicted NBD/HSP70 family sugar kinase|nr:ROK family transcriptional regulator [Treponema sp.]